MMLNTFFREFTTQSNTACKKRWDILNFTFMREIKNWTRCIVKLRDWKTFHDPAIFGYLKLWNPIYGFEWSQYSQNPQGFDGVEVLASRTTVPVKISYKNQKKSHINQMQAQNSQKESIICLAWTIFIGMFLTRIRIFYKYYYYLGQGLNFSQ